ncbi:MAG: phosphoglycerate dehydrogenase [Candidatus Lokiarchaeota archaeon]|nr:phosphoglycerate dehydrogenase [Candidatus Lokiarchaeota archaeon]
MSEKKKILVPEQLDEEAIAFLELHDDIEAIVLKKPTKEDLIEKINDVDALIVRSKTKVDANLINAAKNLKVIARAGVGTDNIDVVAAENMGILVVNAPEESLDSVADLTFSLILSVCRKINLAITRTKIGDFNRSDLIGYELNGKTLGIIGFGRIGRKVAKRALPFGLKVVAYDPYVSPTMIDVPQVELMSLEELLKISDIISIHVPLTENTNHLLSKKEFEILKKGAFIINTSRGAVIDTDALHDALLNDKVCGVGLDVVEGDKVDCLLDHQNVIITPHIGASTIDAQRNVGQIIVQEVVSILKGKEPKYPVNFPVLPDDYRDEFYLYKELLKRMALIVLSIPHDPFNKISITFPKRFPRNLINILRRIFLAVYLKPLVSTPINIVNALKIAQERQIEMVDSLVERKREYELIEVNIFKDQTILNYISGYINSQNKPEIAQIDAFNSKFEPEGNMLLIIYEDKPGMIGNISSFLGSNKINIAELQVVREKTTKSQLMIVKLDQKVDKSLVNEMKKIKSIHWLCYNEL